MEVTFGGQMRRYKPLHLLDFDPTRKRMSTIVQDEDGMSYSSKSRQLIAHYIINM